MDDVTESQSLLDSAKTLLSDGEFETCRAFAVRARELESHNPGVPHVLAVVDTLIAASQNRRITETLHDWYAILGVPRYSDDFIEIKDQYKRLCVLLDPNETLPGEDEVPLAREAFSLVNKAWYDLSDKSRKSEYNKEIRTNEKSRSPEHSRKSPWFNIDTGSIQESKENLCMMCYNTLEPDKYGNYMYCENCRPFMEGAAFMTTLKSDIYSKESLDASGSYGIVKGNAENDYDKELKTGDAVVAGENRGGNAENDYDKELKTGDAVVAEENRGFYYADEENEDVVGFDYDDVYDFDDEVYDVGGTDCEKIWATCPYCTNKSEYNVKSGHADDLLLRCKNEECKERFVASDVKLPPVKKTKLVRTGNELSIVEACEDDDSGNDHDSDGDGDGDDMEAVGEDNAAGEDDAVGEGDAAGEHGVAGEGNAAGEDGAAGEGNAAGQDCASDMDLPPKKRDRIGN